MAAIDTFKGETVYLECPRCGEDNLENPDCQDDETDLVQCLNCLHQGLKKDFLSGYPIRKGR